MGMYLGQWQSWYNDSCHVKHGAGQGGRRASSWANNLSPDLTLTEGRPTMDVLYHDRVHGLSGEHGMYSPLATLVSPEHHAPEMTEEKAVWRDIQSTHTQEETYLDAADTCPISSWLTG